MGNSLRCFIKMIDQNIYIVYCFIDMQDDENGYLAYEEYEDGVEQFIVSKLAAFLQVQAVTPFCSVQFAG